MNILVVEDNADLNRSILNLLKAEGHTPSAAHSIAEAKESSRRHGFDIILLDIMLPDGNGASIIDTFRTGFPSRVIMLSALSDAESKKMCYKAGADDYITKPFDMDELLYKTQAIHRQLTEKESHILIGDLIINRNTNELSCGKECTVLQPSQRRLLECLLQKYREGKPLSVEEIGSRENGSADGIQQRARTLVTRTRQSIEQLGSTRVQIIADYGKGYHLEIKR
jgi:DNA-binding response OmpR family regulator